MVVKSGGSVIIIMISLVIIMSGPNENSQKAIIISIISGPNENSQQASISVNVLAANSQDGFFE